VEDLYGPLISALAGAEAARDRATTAIDSARARGQRRIAEAQREAADMLTQAEQGAADAEQRYAAAWTAAIDASVPEKLLAALGHTPPPPPPRGRRPRPAASTGPASPTTSESAAAPAPAAGQPLQLEHDVELEQDVVDRQSNTGSDQPAHGDDVGLPAGAAAGDA
jgi:hypothetical protein